MEYSDCNSEPSKWTIDFQNKECELKCCCNFTYYKLQDILITHDDITSYLGVKDNIFIGDTKHYWEIETTPIYSTN